MLSISFLPLFSSGYYFPYERMMPSSEALSIFGRSIHPNAWKGNSRKLDFRFTEFLEAYPPFWSSWAFTPRLSLLEHLPSHLLRLAFSVLVRISPRSCLFGYPLPEVLMCSLGIHAGLLQRHILHHHFPCLRCSLGFFAHPARIIG